nr:MAG TPA: archeaosine synthase [Caudoviricetes sp.]
MIIYKILLREGDKLAKFEHTQGISRVTFDKTLTVYCPLGHDYYTAHIIVQFAPGTVMMDYLDEEEFFNNYIQGQNLIIEDVVDRVYQHLQDEYKPKYLKVSVRAENAKHFPVTVEKE